MTTSKPKPEPTDLDQKVLDEIGVLSERVQNEIEGSMRVQGLSAVGAFRLAYGRARHSGSAHDLQQTIRIRKKLPKLVET